MEVGATWIVEDRDCMDEDTQFILATYELASTSAMRTRNLSDRATDQAGSVPDAVVTDSLFRNLRSLCAPSGIKVRHLRASRTRSAEGANQIDQLRLSIHGSYSS